MLTPVCQSGQSPDCAVDVLHDLNPAAVVGSSLDSANFYPTIDDSHCYRIHPSLTADYCFNDGLRGKTASGLERIFCGVLVNRIRPIMDRYTGYCNLIRITLKAVLKFSYINQLTGRKPFQECFIMLIVGGPYRI